MKYLAVAAIAVALASVAWAGISPARQNWGYQASCWRHAGLNESTCVVIDTSTGNMVRRFDPFSVER